MACCGKVTGEVKDMPQKEADRSNLSTIYMHSDLSYNYKFSPTDFMPCEDETATFTLATINCNEDASAVVTFADCAGNTTDTLFEYKALKVHILINGRGWEPINYHKVFKNTFADSIIKIINFSKTNTAIIEEIGFKKNPEYFTILDLDYNPLNLPVHLNPLDSLSFILRYKPEFAGVFTDTMYVADTCGSMNYFYVSSVVISDDFISDIEPPIYIADPDTSDPYIFFKGKIVDKPDDVSIRSNLLYVNFLSNNSNNVSPYIANFNTCIDNETQITVGLIDPKKDALAELSISDCAGNDTILQFRYEAYKLELITLNIIMPDVDLKTGAEKPIWLYNKSKVQTIVLNSMKLSLGNQGFTILDKLNNSLTLPIKILPLDSFQMIVHFVPPVDGYYRDTLILRNNGINWANCILEGWTKGTDVFENTSTKNIFISPNPANEKLIVTYDDNIIIDEIKIYNLLSFEQNCPIEYFDDKIVVNTSSLNTGLYFIKLKTQNGFVFKKFLIE
jgi:hypothetical protein